MRSGRRTSEQCKAIRGSADILFLSRGDSPARVKTTRSPTGCQVPVDDGQNGSRTFKIKRSKSNISKSFGLWFAITIWYDEEVGSINKTKLLNITSEPCLFFNISEKVWFKCSSYAENKIPSNASIYFSGCYIMVVLSHNKAHVLHVLEKKTFPY